MFVNSCTVQTCVAQGGGAGPCPSSSGLMTQHLSLGGCGLQNLLCHLVMEGGQGAGDSGPRAFQTSYSLFQVRSPGAPACRGKETAAVTGNTDLVAVGTGGKHEGLMESVQGEAHSPALLGGAQVGQLEAQPGPLAMVGAGPWMDTWRPLGDRGRRCTP